MRHYYILVGNFQISLRKYLKAVDREYMYDTVKKRYYRSNLDEKADVVIVDAALDLQAPGKVGRKKKVITEEQSEKKSSRKLAAKNKIS